MDGLDDRARQASANRRQVGKMEDPEVVDTGGPTDRGEMLRMGIQFFGTNGPHLVDRASFQPIGYQTAITGASSPIVPLDVEDQRRGTADFRTSP